MDSTSDKGSAQLTQNDDVEMMDTSNDNVDTPSVSRGGDGDTEDIEISAVDDADADGEAELDPDEFDDEVDERYIDSGNDDDVDAEASLQGEYADGSPTKSQTTTSRRIDSVFGEFSFAGPSDEDRDVENIESTNTLRAEAEKWVSQDTCNTALVSSERHFICIKYPGVIRNKDKALATLGGVSEIMEASKTLGKLDLKFRPDDPYCKSTIGTYKKNNHLLLRCRRRKAKDSPSTSSEDDSIIDGYEYKVEVIGVVDGIFSFHRPCDFQYLPVAKDPNSNVYKELLSKMMLKFEDERQEFFNRDVPLFLPPYVFSRSERPAKYLFQDDDDKGEEYIGLARKTRSKGTQRVVFNTQSIPQKPNKDALERYQRNAVNQKKVCLDPLIQLFEERPLWSRVGIIARLRATEHVSLKNSINMVAYYFGSGPWIHLWCKFGYDPRKDPKAKLYQTVDFRIRKTWNREKVQSKRRSDSKGSYRIGLNTVRGHRLPPIDQLTNQITAAGRDGSGPSTSQEEITGDVDIDIHYQFVPNRLPPYRQMYYQVCDVFEDKIQVLAHQNDGKEVECTEKDGWCVPDFLAMSRDILTEYADNLLSTYTACFE